MVDRPAPRARRADAVMDLVRVALAHAAGGHATGADRYLVHIIVGDRHAQLADGTPLDAATAEQVACDTSTVTHLIGPHGQPLALGRKTREWSTAQRRAALVRDGGHCRFPGCQRTIADLHHQHHWNHGGPPDLDNAFLACPHHHTLLHHGYGAEGDPNTRLTFTRPDGSTLGTTTPARRSWIQM
ncbi:MAG: DUF222 domain-containing protein [Acidimicrobiales bacterium]